MCGVHPAYRYAVRHQCVGCSGCLSRVSGSLTLSLEDFFEQHGRRVAAWPGVVVLCCLALTFFSAAGFLFFTKELRPFRLWLPQESEFIKVLRQVINFWSMFLIISLSFCLFVG